MRYFIASTLKTPEKEKVEELRMELATRFDVRAALHIPPHLTLVAPFETGDIELLERELARLSRTTKAFFTNVIGFGSFDERVWFLDVEQNDELRSLRETIARTVTPFFTKEENRKRSGTHFHVTLAYKDVSPPLFQEVGHFLKSAPLPVQTLAITTISIYQDGKQGWSLYSEFDLERHG